MFLIDTHSHLFLEEFDKDRGEAIKRAIEKGVKHIVLPNVDCSTAKSLIDICQEFPDNCFPAMGLHPSSVKANYKDELAIIEQYFDKHKFYAIGETGIDLYWDKTYFEEQKIVFKRQIELSIHYELPIIIHSRNSINEIIDVLNPYSGLKGIFHCFPGDSEQAKKVIDMGFMLGIGGVVTYKNSEMQEVVRNTELKHLVLETDAPYLTPAPFRGKRNESSYIYFIAEKIALLKGVPIETVAEETTNNALSLFNLS